MLQKSGHTAKVTLNTSGSASCPFVATSQEAQATIEIRVLSAAQLELWASLRQGRQANGVPLKLIRGSMMETKQLNCVSFGFKSHSNIQSNNSELPERTAIPCAAETGELLPVVRSKPSKRKTRKTATTFQLGAASVGLDNSSRAPLELILPPPNEDAVSKLTALGFEQDLCQQVVAATKSFEEALEFLLASSC